MNLKAILLVFGLVAIVLFSPYESCFQSTSFSHDEVSDLFDSKTSYSILEKLKDFSEDNKIVNKVISLIEELFNNNNQSTEQEISGDSYDGYTLFTPEFTTKTLLINNDGETIHSWESNNIQGLPVYLLENGHLIRGCSSLRNSRFIAGGVTGRIEMYDWNNTLIWEFDYSTNNHCLHHDIEVLPNGNILMTAWEYKTAAEATC